MIDKPKKLIVDPRGAKMWLKWPKSTLGIQRPKFYQGPILTTTDHGKY